MKFWYNVCWFGLFFGFFWFLFFNGGLSPCSVHDQLSKESRPLPVCSRLREAEADTLGIMLTQALGNPTPNLSRKRMLL